MIVRNATTSDADAVTAIYRGGGRRLGAREPLLGPLRLPGRRRAGVYIARAGRGGGVGRALLTALCDEAERAGLYKLTSRIFSDNAASRAAHVAAGFREVGFQRRHGRLDGRWIDCVLVERLLGDAA